MGIPVKTVSLALLLWALTKGPAGVQDPLLSLIARSPVRISQESLVYALKWLVGIGLARQVNGVLNAAALNNGRYTSDRGKWNWTSEVAVVTGGCSGIGEAIVRALHRKGVKVAILDMAPLPDRLKQIAAHYSKCDVTDPEAINSAAQEIKSKLGPVSILVNNAGIGNESSILEAPPHKVKKLFEVNLISHWYTCQAFVPDMVKRNKGHVVEIASMSSFVSVGFFADYSAAKLALVSFSETLREQLRTWYQAPDVHVTNVHPLWVATPLVESAKEMIEKKSGKMLTPAKVADEVCQQIFRCKGNQLIIPERLSFISTIRAWPFWLQRFIRQGSNIKREDIEKVREAMKSIPLAPK